MGGFGPPLFLALKPKPAKPEPKGISKFVFLDRMNRME